MLFVLLIIGSLASLHLLGTAVDQNFPLMLFQQFSSINENYEITSLFCDKFLSSLANLLRNFKIILSCSKAAFAYFLSL